MPAALRPGFADPVFAAQAVFRSILDALSRPGTPCALATDLDPPPPLSPELAAVALALADPDAPIWLDAPLRQAPAVGGYLRFHTGARIVDAPAEAAFALVAEPADLPPFDRFAIGTDEYPDRSTTLVVAVDDLHRGAPIRLAGPGIAGETTLSPTLPLDFADRLRGNRALFPRGLDVLIVSRGLVAGLPRSATVAGSA